MFLSVSSFTVSLPKSIEVSCVKLCPPLESYGYQQGDITMMLDDEQTLSDPTRSHLVPTKDNIVRPLVSKYCLLPY